ncbi:sigma-70 family RNA polymerase sigma factor [Aquibacillus halophilus]|uniref:Sigma-70 family RNA polymerase sigma factor n=1 Tax=Aquibacillus halophilus TaxID=930132 RepID=A0A6A8DBE0_9BACI|nr:sigma-70 family RNA polymerase sigma factor [Aquibacillus halophilus]MRH41081.1 sigma-70 family RNA polymerase sigma factor [Aquibacillus halophilus]
MDKISSTISEWFHQYSHDVYDFLVYYTGTTDVEDLVQEVFIKAGKGINSFEDKASPKTWIFSIARNVAIDEARKKKNKIRKNSLSFDERIWNDNDNQQTPEEILLQNEQKQQLYNAINMTKQSYRDVLILRGIKGLSVKETAEVLNWKETKVRTNYHRAIKALRQAQSGGISHEQA